MRVKLSLSIAFDKAESAAYDASMTVFWRRWRRSPISFLVFRMVALFLLIGGSAADVISAENRDAETPREKTLIVGLLSDPATLNPLVSTTVQQKDIVERMFLKLLDEEDDFLHFKPRLAETWAYGEDSLSIIFHLREDVVWTDGMACTAHDVRFTWEMQRDTLVAWPSRHLKDRISKVEVLDDYTVVFHFSARYPYQLMDANDGVIVPKHLLERVPKREFRSCAFGREPVGNGPYVLPKWVPGQYVELVRNPDYYEEGKPRVSRVIYRIVPDMLTLITQLKAGEIDCLEGVPPDAVAEILEKYEEIRIYKYPSRKITFISWNLTHDLLKERGVRRALTMAINRGEIIETLFHGMAAECTSPMSPLIWAYNPNIEPIPYDPEGARRLLSSYGWEDRDGDGVLEQEGRKFELEMITNHGNQLRVDIMTMVEAYLRKVGVKVNARPLEWNYFIERVKKSDFESCVLEWKVGTRADLTELWHSRSSEPGGFNRVYYKNVEVDSLIDLATSLLDPEIAKALWWRCQQIIYEDQPFTFIAIPYEVNALRKTFCGVKPSAISFFATVRDWYISETCR